MGEPYDIGWAVMRMREGRHVRRRGWNGRGMHLYLEDWLEGAMHFPSPSGGTFDRKYERCVVMYTAQGTHQPGWLCSQADLLAEDWEIAG